MNQHLKVQKKKKQTPETDREPKLFWSIYKPHYVWNPPYNPGPFATVIIIS